MKCPIVLLVVTMVVLAEHAVSETVFMHKGTPSMEFSRLLSVLGDPMPGSASEGAKKVFERLVETIDKEKTDDRLKGFTVGQLVALNEWSIEDCEDDKLEERRSICETFSTKEQTKSVRPPKREMEDGDFVTSSGDQIGLNLGKYCWRIIEAMEGSCPSKRVEALYQDRVVSKRLHSFGNKVSLGQLTPKQVFLPNLGKVVRKRLDELEKKDPKEAAALKENCAFIMKEFNKPEAHFEVSLSLSHDVAICKRILGFETSADDDEASS